MKLPVLLLVFTVLGTITSKSQSITSFVINASGNTYAQGYYRIDWSIGEMAVIESLSAANGSNTVTNGFLQPDKPLENTSQKFSPDEIKILPNPTYNNVEINFLTVQQGVLHIDIFDAGGKNILSRKTASYGIGSIERFSLSRFAAGTYFIKIELDPTSGSVKKTGTYKIVKVS
jgi:hypothetical protein